jgi:signal transduction histidine kinase
MKYKIKVFFSIYLTALLLCALIFSFIYFDSKERLENEYIDRYHVIGTLVGKALMNAEGFAEKSGIVALNHVYQLEKEQGQLNEQDLRNLAIAMNVSEFYVTNEKGQFTLSTETSIEVVDQGLFDFCEGYKDLITGESQIEKTPILPSYPFKGPFKFVMIANHDRTKILEVGIHLSSISSTLKDAIGTDKNLISMGFYTPSGFKLGHIQSNGDFTEGGDGDALGRTINSNQTELKKDRFLSYQKVNANVENCCECDTKGITSEDGEYFYILRTEVSTAALHESISQLKDRFIFLFLVALGAGILLAHYLSNLLVRRLFLIQEGAEKIILSGDLSLRLNIQGKDEVSELASTFDKMIESLQISQEKSIESEKERTLGELARQVAHDIRSPLSALASVTHTLSDLPEDKRVLVRSAISRIRDIANGLLGRGNLSSSELSFDNLHSQSNESSVELISNLIEGIVTEKRAQYHSIGNLEIDTQMERDSYGIFCSVNPGELKRVLSNLINNAVESLIKKDGQVEVRLRAVGTQAEIVVTDNGCGISSEHLPQLGEKGATFTKEGGSGLGLYHAKQSIEKWGGQFKIDSEEGKGTKVTLLLPKAEAPSWFVPEIIIKEGSEIVILDDDHSIHQIWKGRLQSIKRTNIEAQDQLNLIHFSSGPSFLEWFQSHGSDAKNRIYLFDYELLGEEKSGLDLIEETGIQYRVILVTSRYDEKSIRDRCKKLGIRLIPKGMSGFVPISIQKDLDSAGEQKDRPDAILIDDDKLVHITWKLAAKISGKTLVAFDSVQAFLKEAENYSFDTPIYIDSNLGGEIRGEVEAKNLYALGFQNLFLATGHAKDHFDGMPWIQEIVGKTPPFDGP